MWFQNCNVTKKVECLNTKATKSVVDVSQVREEKVSLGAYFSSLWLRLPLAETMQKCSDIVSLLQV